MSEPIRRKAFKYGKDVAVRLPKEYGLKPGDKVELKKGPKGLIMSILSEE